MRIGVLADVMGRPGRQAVRQLLPTLRADYGLDLVVANGENLTGGFGCNAKTAREMLDAGVDVLTLGNHAWSQRDFRNEISRFPMVIRPANFKEGEPGQGWCVVEAAGYRVGIVNLIGRIYMADADCPFATADRALETLRDAADIVCVDMHCEATSEKQAMGWHLDGRVAVVWGSHTHVQTADERILPKGTAFITDVGMTGPYDSVIGLSIQSSLPRFKMGTRGRLEVARENVRLCACVIDIDTATGLSRSIERLTIPADV